MRASGLERREGEDKRGIESESERK